MEIQSKIRTIIEGALAKLDIDAGGVFLEHPNERDRGDYSTNIAMILAKQEKKDPKTLAKKIIAEIDPDDDIEKIEIAGPGFINFFLSREFFANSLRVIQSEGAEWGKNSTYKGKKIMVEYTDPNPFKVFHIGHLMSNTIGESIARLIEFSGAEVKRANYQGDVGPHVARAIWGLEHGKGSAKTPEGLGEAYAAGAKAYEDHKEEIDGINRAIYGGADRAINELYEKGRRTSLEHFEKIYQKLGTRFDYSFFESGTWYEGEELVRQNVPKVFTESDGAIIFEGEKFDKSLHTRVFITSEGIPTYEAKDLGLAYKKKEEYDFDLSITITASEQETYFAVMLKALEQFDPDLASKILHVSHGMMKLPGGKMSSRTGDVISAESLISEVEEKVLDIMKERDIEDKEAVAVEIAIGALKYSILKQDPGKDIIYDLERSLSFEGDSGPYLQYARTRAGSVLEKAEGKGSTVPKKASSLETFLYRFPEVVEKAQIELKPHHVLVYLTELAAEFNRFYATEKIIGSEFEGHFLLLTKAFAITMENGLSLLGIRVPEKM